MDSKKRQPMERDAQRGQANREESKERPYLSLRLKLDPALFGVPPLHDVEQLRQTAG